MGFFDRFKSNGQILTDIRNRLGGVESGMEDIKLAAQREAPGPKQVNQGVRKLRRQSPSTLSWQNVSSARGLYDSSRDYTGPAHNLWEIAKAADVESYIGRAFQRHRELCMKQGWNIVGRDLERVRYVKRRLAEIALVSKQTTGAMLRELFYNLIAYANSFLILKRDPLRSSGVRTQWHGRKLEPISGAYHADPTTMTVKQTATGLITSWRQKLHPASYPRKNTKNEKFYPERDVVHVVLDKRSGFVFGTPYAISVLDDIRLMRRLEELVDIIAHKHAFPLFTFKVGTEQKPAGSIRSTSGNLVAEVDLAKSEIENMEFEGGLVITERHEIQMIGAEGKAMDLTPYLKHIERRVQGGLRLSDIDLGRGESANRNTAQSVTQTLVDACTEIQSVVSEEFSWQLIFPLLMEGGFNVDLSDLDNSMIFLKFPAIDTEEQRSQENHDMALYQGSYLGETEARGRGNMDPIQESEREDMFIERHEIPLIKAEARAKAAAGVGGGSSTGKSAGAQRSTASKNRPANQRGTSPSKPRISQNALEACKANYVDQVLYHYQEAGKDWIAGLRTKSGRSSDVGWMFRGKPKLDMRLPDAVAHQKIRAVGHLEAAREFMMEDAKKYLLPLIDIAFQAGKNQTGTKDMVLTRSETDEFFRTYVGEPLKGCLRAGISRVKFDSWDKQKEAWPSALSLSARLASLQGDLTTRVSRQADLAYAFGFKKACEKAGIETIKITNELDGTQKETTVPVFSDVRDLVLSGLDQEFLAVIKEQADAVS
jgi:hypothetical protein